MTTRRRTLIAPKDVVGIEYECTHCGARFSVPIHKIDRKVQKCPNCEKSWISSETPAENTNYSDDKSIGMFLLFLKDLQARSMGALIRLEIETEDDKLKP
jgi:predicted Zn finger-like uncharacterized protein